MSDVAYRPSAAVHAQMISARKAEAEYMEQCFKAAMVEIMELRGALDYAVTGWACHTDEGITEDTLRVSALEVSKELFALQCKRDQAAQEGRP